VIEATADDYHEVEAIAFSPKDPLLASAARSEKMVCLWNMETGRREGIFERKHLPIKSYIAFSPDGGILAITDSGVVNLYEVHTGRVENSLKYPWGWVFTFAFSPDGATFAAIHRPKADEAMQSVRLWDTHTGQEKAVLKHSEFVDYIAFSPDSTILASGSRDSKIRLWDARTGRLKEILQGHSGTPQPIFSPDGTTLATRSLEGTVRLWNFDTGRERARLAGHTDKILDIAFSPDGATLASGSSDKTVRLWDVSTGEEKDVLEGHTKAVPQLVFSPDGAILASGSRDTTVRLWKLDT
jgi:WD40 repeat protein